MDGAHVLTADHPPDQGPTVVVGSDKHALSRALGAAFLSHQVEQLEKSVGGPGRGQGGAWRGRRTSPSGGRGGGRMAPGPGLQMNGPAAKNTQRRVTEGGMQGRVLEGQHARKNSAEEKEKDADVIVVDASVLVHCLGQIKAWCREGRSEVLIVPLEGVPSQGSCFSTHSE